MAAAGGRGERLPWLDGLRGAAVLAIIPLNARWLLHPRAAYTDPTVIGELDWLSWTWWWCVETAFDETTLWLLAGVFGIALAAARERDDDPGWTRRHRARLAALGATGLLQALLVWPGDILLPYAVTAVLISGAVRDRRCRPWMLAAAAAAVPPAATIWAIHADAEALRAAGPLGGPYTAWTADYNAWESSLYGGSLRASLEVKWAQTKDALSGTLPTGTLWQAAAAMLAGLWWYRAGRHRTVEPATAGSVAAAGALITAAAAGQTARSGFDHLTTGVGQEITYIGGALLALGTVMAATRLPADAWTTPTGTWLRSCGRRSLSIYVIANITLAAVAQGWGLGLHGRLDHRGTIAVTALVAVMCAGFGLWTRNVRHDTGGPEGIWRLSTRLLASGRPRRRTEPQRRTAGGT